MNYPDFAYDAKEHIIFVTHPKPVHLETPDDVTSYFRAANQYWRNHGGGKKAYIVVDYANFAFNPDLRALYTQALEDALRTSAETIVRYGGSLSVRAAARVNAIDLHTPSNLYASKEEAVRVVRRLRDGSLKAG